MRNLVEKRTEIVKGIKSKNCIYAHAETELSFEFAELISKMLETNGDQKQIEI